ncbi:MAG: hypothetical protein E7463_11730 [Ruminococcaceae bacterium]|nr:hypothetical protein [Oscillospiraceae bacterium]
MEQSNQRMGRAALMFLPSKVLEGLIGVVTLSYTASALTYDAYERFNSTNTVVVFANLLLLGWLINSTTRYVGDYAGEPAKARRFFSTQTALWMIPNLAVLAVAAIIYAVTGSTVWLGAFGMLAATSIYQITLGMLVQTQRQLASVVISLLTAVSKPAVIWLTCRILSGGAEVDRILPAVLGYALSELLGGLLGVLTLKMPRYLRVGGWDREIFRKFIAYGVPLMGVSVSVGLLNMVDRFIIMAFGMSYGVYHANNTITSTVFSLLTVGIMRAVYPSVLRGYREGGKEKAQPLLDAGVRMYLLIALPAAAGLAGVAENISRFLYPTKPELVAGYAVIALSGFAMFFSGLNEYAIKTWELRQDTKPIMVNALIAVGVKLAVSVALLPVLDFYGAAVGSLVGFMTYCGLSMFRARKTLLFRVKPRTLAAIGGGSLLCAVGANLTTRIISGNTMGLLAAIAVGVVVYAAVLVLSGEVKEELAAVRRLIARRKV